MMQLWALLMTYHLSGGLGATSLRPMGALSHDAVERVAQTMIEESRKSGQHIEVDIVPNGTVGE